MLAIGSFGRFYRCLSPVAAVAFPQVPVPSSSGGMLAIGSFAPGVSTGACPLGMSPDGGRFTHAPKPPPLGSGWLPVGSGWLRVGTTTA